MAIDKIKKKKYPWSQILVSVILSGPFLRRLKGKENVPSNGGFIVAANHCSYMDHLLLGGTVLRIAKIKVKFLAKKEHFDDWFQRAWHEWAGAIPIDRETGGKEALDTAIKALNTGDIVGIYPEGTRSRDGKVQQGKTGVARLALSAKVPVLPVGLIGTFDVLPRGVLVPRFKRAEVIVGKPMSFEKYYGKENDKAVLREVTTKIMKEIARLSRQKYKF